MTLILLLAIFFEIMQDGNGINAITSVHTQKSQSNGNVLLKPESTHLTRL